MTVLLSKKLYVSAENEFVFINFYADWCRFSNMLAPIWDEAADKISTEFVDKGRVLIGKVDCDQEGNILSHQQCFESWYGLVTQSPIK